jgi:hypothetical protein
MSLTKEDIINRNYTYVSVTIPRGRDRLEFVNFLVSSPYKEKALELAKQYTERIGISSLLMSSPGGSCKCCHCYNLYPRKYIREARVLFSEGKFI